MHLLGVTLICAAFISLIIYLLALIQLVSQPRHQGLVRTAGCRVIGALLYMIVGGFSATGDSRAGLIAVGMFIVLQFMWWINSLADVRITQLENRSQMIYRRGMRKVIAMASYNDDPYIASESLATPEDLAAADPHEQLRRTVATNSTKVTAVEQDQKSLQTRTLALAALAGIALLIGVVGLIIGVMADNRSRDNVSRINNLQAAQAQTVDELHRMCDLYGAMLSFYSEPAKNRYLGGPAAYDQIYIELQQTADMKKCNIKHVVPGT